MLVPKQRAQATSSCTYRFKLASLVVLGIAAACLTWYYIEDANSEAAPPPPSTGPSMCFPRAVTSDRTIRFDEFGYTTPTSSVANLGDQTGNQVADVVMGVMGPSTGGVHLVLRDTDGTEKYNQKLVEPEEKPGGGWSRFGDSVATIMGPINEDGGVGLVVGAPHFHGDGGPELGGAVYLTVVTRTGDEDDDERFHVAPYHKISCFELAQMDEHGNCPLVTGGQFGKSLAVGGDIDEDGFVDLFVGAPGYEDLNNFNGGKVYAMKMRATATGDGFIMVRYREIPEDDHHAKLPRSFRLFGWSMTSLGYLNGGGLGLVVSAPQDQTFFPPVVVVEIQPSDYSVEKTTWIYDMDFEGEDDDDPRLEFGLAVASVGDLDGNGMADLAVTSAQATHVLLLEDVLSLEGEVVEVKKAATIRSTDHAIAMSSLGDVDGDGVMELAIVHNGEDGADVLQVPLATCDYAAGETCSAVDDDEDYYYECLPPY